MKFSFRPTEGAFFELFTQAAQNLVQATATLAELFLPGTSPSSVSERLAGLEHESDLLTHDLYRLVNSTFITPFDREDIYQLGSRLDDVMDHLEAAGTVVHLYGLVGFTLPQDLQDLVGVLSRQAAATAAAMPRLQSFRNLSEFWVEVNSLENEGDQLHRRLSVRLFSGEFDPLTVLKLKGVGDELEAACDAFELVAGTVESIATKEG